MVAKKAKLKVNPKKVQRSKTAAQSPPTAQFVVLGIRKGGLFVDLHSVHENATAALDEAWDVSNTGSTAIVCLGYASKGKRDETLEAEDVKRAASILSKSKGTKASRHKNVRGFFAGLVGQEPAPIIKPGKRKR